MSNLYDLFVKIGADTSGLRQGFSSALSATVNFGKQAVAVTAQMTTAALGAAATGIVAISKQAVEAYGNYEQLVGGVETLFGAQGMSLKQYADSEGKTVDEVSKKYGDLKEAQRIVLQNASEAYKTAGMSANAYMETVTSFSAALVSSTGGDTVTAAKAAQQAIVDMSDNANKMGTSIESIQNAYQGFAKQNYTMLDNLKLGYGGTKEEMQRLLDDAGKLSGIKYDMSSLDDVYEAIHVVQTEMGITGTTAKEASSTIQGSFGMLKASWENLVTGLADKDANLGGLIDNVIESAMTVGDNVLPVIDTTLERIGEAITTKLPEVLEKSRSIVTSNLPGLVSTASEMVSEIMTAVARELPTALMIITAILPGLLTDVLPPTITAITKSLPILISAIANMIPTVTASISAPLMEAGGQLITFIIDGLTNNIPTVIAYGFTLISSLANGITNNSGTIIATAFSLIALIISGLAQGLPELMVQAVEIVFALVDGILENIDTIIDCAIELILALADGLVKALPQLIAKAPIIVEKLVSALVRNAPKLLVAAAQLLLTLVRGIVQSLTQLEKAGREMLDAIKKGITDGINKFKEIGKNIVDGLWNGIKESWKGLTEDVGGLFSELVKNAKSKLGIKSPSRVFAEIGRYMGEGVGVGWENAFSSVKNNILSDLDFSTAEMTVPNVANTQYESLREIVEDLGDKINDLDMNVTLQGDAAGIFRVVRNENKVYKKRTGASAFA